MNNQIRIVNNFSLNMVDAANTPFVRFEPITLEELKDDLAWCQIDSHMNSPEIAHLMSSILETELPLNPKYIAFTGKEFRLIVVTVTGNAIPAGATSIPRGTKVRLVEVLVERPHVVDIHEMSIQQGDNWPMEYVAEEGPTLLRVHWKNGETTRIQITKGFDGELAAYVHSRSGLIGDFIVACSEQTWMDVISKESAA